MIKILFLFLFNKNQKLVGGFDHRYNYIENYKIKENFDKYNLLNILEHKQIPNIVIKQDFGKSIKFHKEYMHINNIICCKSHLSCYIIFNFVDFSKNLIFLL